MFWTIYLITWSWWKTSSMKTYYIVFLLTDGNFRCSRILPINTGIFADLTVDLSEWLILPCNTNESMTHSSLLVITIYFPDEPKPSFPRVVSSSCSTSLTYAYEILSAIIWAMRSPLLIVNGASPKLNTTTPNGPVYP